MALFLAYKFEVTILTETLDADEARKVIEDALYQDVDIEASEVELKTQHNNVVSLEDLTFAKA